MENRGCTSANIETSAPSEGAAESLQKSHLRSALKIVRIQYFRPHRELVAQWLNIRYYGQSIFYTSPSQDWLDSGTLGVGDCSLTGPEISSDLGYMLLVLPMPLDILLHGI